MATFNHPLYDLIDNNIIKRKPNIENSVSMTESAEITQELARFVEAKLIHDYKFVPLLIPDDQELSTTILASPGWTEATKLLIIVQNSSGSQLGIFSRSMCFDYGLDKGTWLSYIEEALSNEYAVILLNPNANSIIKDNKKILIKGSESPEIHTLNFYMNILPQMEKLSFIALLSYGNGSTLCKDLYLKEMIKSIEACGNATDNNLIKAFLTIEASHLVEKDDTNDIKEALGNLVVNLEINSSPLGYRLAYRKESIGCNSYSLGLPKDKKADINVGESVSMGKNFVFQYLKLAEIGGNSISKSFSIYLAKALNLDPNSSVVLMNPDIDENQFQDLNISSNNGGGAAGGTSTQQIKLNQDTSAPPAQEKVGFFSRLFGRSQSTSNKNDKQEDKLTVNDFDLLKIVGKGAFGKVMLVRKKEGIDEGKVYAMKVLKKEAIAAKGQIENTKSERDILFEVRHPYIVRLRYAFQSVDKLYLVTDYYNGGTLYYHLRKSRQFNEERVRFYASELLLALDHLHKLNIIYRDLKLENILLDSFGHIALTDFGLSKQNIDVTGGATTFCGTAEYISPELLKGQKYGPAVDWWSFGILIYEMLHGRTPYFDKNRKLMFYRIINAEPTFPPSFSPEACQVIRGLLKVNEFERLGSGPRGVLDIIETDFFKVMDFEKLMKKEITPPFIPQVVNEFDTKYVPKAFLQAQLKDSVVEKKKVSKKAEKKAMFEEFTFAGEKHLDD